MIAVDEADRILEGETARPGRESCTLESALGRVLSQEVCADRAVPPFDRAMMDGYAIDSGEAGGGCRYRVESTARAGAPQAVRHAAGGCVQIATGAVLPVGTDCVVPLELVEIAAGGSDLVGSEISLHEDADTSPFHHVHRHGSDRAAGAVLLSPGRRIGANEVAVLASCGYASVSVSRRPRVAVVSTGDELVPVDTDPQPHQIRRSNQYALAAALTTAGVELLPPVHIADQPRVLTTRLGALLDDADIVITSGAVSRGVTDHLPEVFTALGVKCLFHRVAQRPGRPLYFGRRGGDAVVFGLPGNPVSVMVCLVRYVLPWIDRALATTPRTSVATTLATPVRTLDSLTSFVPVSLQFHQGGLVATPQPTANSGDFVGLTETAGFVSLPPAAGTIEAGAVVPFFPWDHLDG